MDPSASVSREISPMCAATADPHTLFATRRSIVARPDGASRLSRPAPPRALFSVLLRVRLAGGGMPDARVCPPVSARKNVLKLQT
jgi:hypothetical protein